MTQDGTTQDETTVELTIESLAFGGAGVARNNAKVWFIPYGVPGDRIIAGLIRDRKRFAFGKILRILEPSPHRRKPSCPLFGECGGCQWLHIAYPQQLAAKQRILVDALRGLPVPELAPIVPSAEIFGYRRYCRLKGDIAGNIGFLKSGSHDVVNMTVCPILRGSINHELDSIREYLLDHRSRLAPRKAPYNIEVFDDDRSVRRALQPFDPSLGFHQANASINMRMRQHIEQITEALFKRRRRRLDLFDLYCGDGNFSLGLVRFCRSITGIDSSGVSIRTAQERARAIETDTAIDYRRRDAIRFGSYTPLLRGRDMLIIDPPRSGMKKTAAALADLAVPSLLYISCSPPDLARDLQPFLANGYGVTSIQPFDMFPHTSHVESIVHLEKYESFG